MLNNYSKDSSPIFVATVVSFDDQKEQVTGLGWGWRCKRITNASIYIIIGRN